MKKLVTIVIVLATMLALCSMAYGQGSHILRNTLWIGTDLLEDADNFYQLTYRHPINQKDILMIDALTWMYEGPMGVHGSTPHFYPGKISAYGIGLGYQRFHWRQAFTTARAISLLQHFYDETDTKIQQGYQLNLQLTAGYRIELLWNRVFVEPAYTLRYWPVNTNFPETFEKVERGERNYKIEPSLSFGLRF